MFAARNALLTKKKPVPVFDAIGAGQQTSGVSSGSFNITATAGATALLFIVGANNNLVSGTPTYGGTAMTLAGTLQRFNNVGTNGYITVYKLVNVPGGTKTVAYNFAANLAFCAQCITYSNVTSVATATNVFGTGTTASATNTPTGTNLAIQGFAGAVAVRATSGGVQRQLFTGLSPGLAIIEQPPTGTVTGTVSSGWAGTNVVLS
jgi:hypothetical protein